MVDLDVRIETIQNNVKALNTLFDELEAGVRSVNSVSGQQTTAVWTDIPSCAQFAAEYTRTLRALDTRLNTAWKRIAKEAQALCDATALLVASDEDAARTYGAGLATDLDALMDRAKKGPTPLIDISAIAAAGAAVATGVANLAAGVGPAAIAVAAVGVTTALTGGGTTEPN